MPQILCGSTLLVLPVHRHVHHHCVPPQWNRRPPLHLSLTCTTVIVCNDHHILQPVHVCGAARWEDSNAEFFRTQNFNYNSDEDDEDTEDDATLEQRDDVFQEYIDSIWIFKVLKSYGVLLPFILVSMVLTTDPKSFLMALAVPIGQSTFSFALKKMWGSKGKRRKRKNKTQSSSRVVDKFWKGNRVGSQGNKKKKMGYKSSFASYDGSSFGGWDQLDRGSDEFQFGSSTSSGQRVGRSSEKPPSKKSRLSERIRKSDAPLLLRLLIAAFPFLGSWTKML